jgi:hypothetical protein
MSDPQNPVIPAGWHPDPAGTPRNRWWDGQQWTEHYAEPQEPAAAQAPAATAIQAPYSPGTLFVTGDPYSAKPAPTFERAPYTNAPYTTAGTPLVAPEGVPIYTNFVWAILAVQVLAPIISIAILLSAGPEAFASSVMANASLSLGVNLLSFVAYGVSVWLAYLDYRTLANAGVPSPFHWAFTFINTPVYLIGRGIVMRRRTGRGMATVWIGLVPVVLIVLGVMAAIVIPILLALSYRG